MSENTPFSPPEGRDIYRRCAGSPLAKEHFFRRVVSQEALEKATLLDDSTNVRDDFSFNMSLRPTSSARLDEIADHEKAHDRVLTAWARIMMEGKCEAVATMEIESDDIAFCHDLIRVEDEKSEKEMQISMVGNHASAEEIIKVSILLSASEKGILTRFISIEESEFDLDIASILPALSSVQEAVEPQTHAPAKVLAEEVATVLSDYHDDAGRFVAVLTAPARDYTREVTTPYGLDQSPALTFIGSQMYARNEDTNFSPDYEEKQHPLVYFRESVLRNILSWFKFQFFRRPLWGST